MHKQLVQSQAFEKAFVWQDFRSLSSVRPMSEPWSLRNSGIENGSIDHPEWLESL